MLTVFLCILLVASVIALVVLASPIRFGGSGSAGYREGGKGSHTLGARSWWVSYVHPWVFSVRYSSTDGCSRTVILGFKNKLDDTDNVGIDTDNAGDDGGIDTDDGGTDTSTSVDADDAGINTGNGGADGVGTDGIDARRGGTLPPAMGTDDINTDGEKINTDDADTATTKKNQKKSKPRSFMSSIKSRVSSIKKHKAYKIINDKPLRKKSLRWLRLTAVCLSRMASFEKLALRARVGLRDPSVLGRLYGYFSAARAAVPLSDYPAVELDMEPVFTERCLEVEAEATGRTTLSALLWNLGVVVSTFPYFRLYWVVIRGKKSKP